MSAGLRVTVEHHNDVHMQFMLSMNKQKLHGLSPRSNYTDRATAASRRSGCQLLRIKGATWSAWRVPTAVFSAFFFFFFFPRKSGSAGNRTRASESVAKNSDH
jgi:hypothetical protein